ADIAVGDELEGATGAAVPLDGEQNGGLLEVGRDGPELEHIGPGTPVEDGAAGGEARIDLGRGKLGILGRAVDEREGAERFWLARDRCGIAGFELDRAAGGVASDRADHDWRRGLRTQRFHRRGDFFVRTRFEDLHGNAWKEIAGAEDHAGNE